MVILVPVLLLAAIGLGLVYVRLSNGPVSLSYLKPAIERQISQKLGGLKVTVNDVVLSLADGSGAFRLTDVRVKDRADVVVAQAPLASMQIDRAALLRGQVIPTGIVLIRPRMQLSYSDAGGLSLSFSRNSVDAGGAATDEATPPMHCRADNRKRPSKSWSNLVKMAALPTSLCCAQSPVC